MIPLVRRPSSSPFQRVTVQRFARATFMGSIACASVGCGDSSTDADAAPGTLRVILEPEDTIIEGLSAGEGVANIRDGWTVTYDKYIVGVGHVALEYATDGDLTAEDEGSFIVDLTQIPSNGERLWEIEGLRPGRWNFGYELVGGGHGPKRHESVASADFERMQDEDLTYLITGTLTKEDGQSCPPTRYAGDIEAESVGENSGGAACYANPVIEFEFAVRAETVFGKCELDGSSGVAITSGTTSTDAATLHGDHLFFNGFPTGDEGGVIRLAQLWADADLNADGKLDKSEYADILIADMSEWDDRYQLGGAPGHDDEEEDHDEDEADHDDEDEHGVETLGDVVVAQLKTQGHFNGEGECEVDGEAHDH
jgi:hypothetical protein